MKREAYYILIKNCLLSKAKSKSNNSISTLQEPFCFSFAFWMLLIFAHMPCLIYIIIPCKPFHLLLKKKKKQASSFRSDIMKVFSLGMSFFLPVIFYFIIIFGCSSSYKMVCCNIRIVLESQKMDGVLF